jgi:hypothetical protein
LGVTLRKNYGSGFTFPLFFICQKKPNKKRAPLQSLTQNNCQTTKVVQSKYYVLELNYNNEKPAKFNLQVFLWVDEKKRFEIL